MEAEQNNRHFAGGISNPFVWMKTTLLDSNVTEVCCWGSSITSGIIFTPSGNGPISEAMLNRIYDAISGHQATMSEHKQLWFKYMHDVA